MRVHQNLDFDESRIRVVPYVVEHDSLKNTEVPEQYEERSRDYLILCFHLRGRREARDTELALEAETSWVMGCKSY